MQITIKNIREQISNTKASTLVYSGIFLLFAIAVIVIFFMMTRFVTKNINAVFLSDAGTTPSSLNTTTYLTVAKKLGISNNTQNNTLTATISNSAEATEEPTDNATTSIAKNSISINILNSTPKSGIASALAKSLQSAGFAQASVGNEKKPYAVTTIFIKDTATSLEAELLDEVRKYYPATIIATTTMSQNNYDVVIIIGAN